MASRNVRTSIALSIAEYTALDWYADRQNVPTSSLARTLMLEALKPRLQQGTLEGSAYRKAMKDQGHLTIDDERG